MWPNLNWKEIEILAHAYSREVEGQTFYVDRFVVPERPEFPGGYLKDEWSLRLSGRREEKAFILSLRSRRPYLTLAAGSGPRAASAATQSAFGLALNKHLKGAKLLAVAPFPKERLVGFWFEGYGLILSLIPNSPEALLVHGTRQQPEWKVIARSRKLKETAPFVPPTGERAPANPEIRGEWVDSPRAFSATIDRALKEDAFELRLSAAVKTIQEIIRQAQERARQSTTALTEAQRESDWQRFGDLLKATLGSPPPLQPAGKTGAFREVQDYETGQNVSIPCDPKLSPQEQVERFYSHARRKARRIKEARTRLEHFEELARKLGSGIASAPAPGDWGSLEKFEKDLAQLSGRPIGPKSTETGSARKAATGWPGKSFLSKDSLSIWVGRSKEENLALTFKHSRGNDLWLHIRGKPGAHVLVPLPSGKSAPLETLLDAATLAVYYSGGENWGKTEVDYTFKKHVKRIKNSTEASYTHNKTLVIEIDPGRLKRLLGKD